MTKDNEDKGFRVSDKRHFMNDGTEVDDKEKEIDGVDQKEGEKKKEEVKEEDRIPLPEMNFSTFIFSLNSSALFHLGEIPDPVTSKREKNLPLAKQTIDIIGILKEKTNGNLTKEEGMLIDNILYDLRMRYIEKTTQKVT